MNKYDLIVGNWYWTDGNALKTTKAQLKFVGKKHIILESEIGTEFCFKLKFFLEWATES